MSRFSGIARVRGNHRELPMRDFAHQSPLLLCLIIVVFGAMASLVPVSPIEPILLGVAAVSPTWLLLPLLVLVTVSHMSTKMLVFAGGRRVQRAFKGRNRDRYDRALVRLDGHTTLQRSTLFVSSVTGLPPFYLITALCGTLKMPVRDFVVLATTGRAIRFAVLIFLPQLFQARALGAQGRSHPPSVVVTGSGPRTYVLLSGLMGGVAGYRPIATRLAAQGNRVISIDPYQLSIDAADVSFDAIARRVDSVLEARGVSAATVVGHAHGGGVALRLAASAPRRVSQLFLIDVGALRSNHTAVFGSSLGIAAFVLHLPGGRGFVGDRLISGVRSNAQRTGWLTDSTQCDYAAPILDNMRRIVPFARRLGDAVEPEPVEAVVSRIRVPVTVLLGEIRRPAGPGEEEIVALRPLGELLRIETIAGVAHFPHEESPVEVTRLLLSSSVVTAPVGVRR